eukprot:1159458-Pelagomonas_calceolata.AAC.1
MNRRVCACPPLQQQQHTHVLKLMHVQETEAASAGTIGYNRPSLAGWCDISDILNGLINQMRKLHPDGKLPTNLLRLMSELDKESKIFINRTLMEIAVGDDKSFMYESERESSLLEALSAGGLCSGAMLELVHVSWRLCCEGRQSHEGYSK